jgi:nucleoside-diphosphate-sugar epimerase
MACAGSDVVIYASGLGALESERDPKLANAVNGFNAERIAAIARQSGVATFVFLSTTHVYSDFPTNVLSEDLPTLNAQPYASSHALGERLVLALATPRFSVHVLRLSNTFGSPLGDFGSSRRLVIHDFAIRGLTEGTIRLNSPGSTCRDFVPVTYLSRIVGEIVSPSGRNGIPSIINVASGDTKTLLEAASLIQNAIRRITGVTPSLLGDSSTVLTGNRFIVSNKLANSLVSYSPGDFFYEVNRLINFIRETPNA